jgi:hypothetical protein
VGLSEGEGPDGDEDAERNTVPESPLILPNVTIAVPEAPAGMVRELGLALMLKSTTLIVKMME